MAPDRQRPDEVDALVQRRELDDDLEGRRVGVERVERGREQEHRQDHELDEVEVLPRPHERRRGHPDRPEREADEERRRHREDHPRRHDQAQHDHDDHEPDRVQPAADQRPGQLADGHVAGRQRRRQDRREGLVVVELEEEVERALADRPVHRRARQQRRRHEQLVRDGLAARARDVADQRPQPEADREQVEQRLEEARQDDQPAVLVDVQVALDQAERAAAADEQAARQREGGHPRTSARVTVRDRQHRADDDEAEQDRQVDDGQDRLVADGLQRQAARQPDAVPQRGDPGQRLDDRRQLLDREERAR